MSDETIVKILKDRALEIFARGKAAKESMDELNEWNSMAEVIDNVVTMTKFLGFVSEAVALAANDILDTVTNEEKLDAAVEALDDLIKLPWFLENLDGPVIRWMISTAYQATVKKAFK